MTRWHELYEEVGESDWPAFCAWVSSSEFIADDDGLPSVVEFEVRYRGTWDSFRDYAVHLIDAAVVLYALPLAPRRCVDIDGFTRADSRGPRNT